MKKLLLTAAVASALVAPSAFAAVTVYGRAHVAFENQSSDITASFLQNEFAGVTAAEGNDASQDKGMMVTSRASRVGVKADEDLGNGLKALVGIEWQVDMSDTSGTGNIVSRNQTVGLGGGFGTVQLGRTDTPYKSSTGSLDPFADMAGDYNAIIGLPTIDLDTPAGTGAVALGNELEERANNAIMYTSPDLSGLKLQAMMAFGEKEKNSSTTAGDMMSFAVTYSAGPLYLAAAMEKWDDNETTSPNTNGAEGMRLGAGYDLGAAKIGFVWENGDYSGDSTAPTDPQTEGDAMLLNVSVPMGNSKIIAEYGTLDVDYKTAGVTNDEGTLMAVGYVHNFSKTSNVYAQYSSTSFETDTSTGRRDLDVQNVLSLGMMVNF